MSLETHKSSEFKFRLDSVTADLLERAKNHTKLNKSRSIREKAQAVILEHEKTAFTRSDWEMFFDLLENPAAPTAKMRKAASFYEGFGFRRIQGSKNRLVMPILSFGDHVRAART
jgi:uncharacterized protein (DUF1778 family)